jgi:hypothetical protein
VLIASVFRVTLRHRIIIVSTGSATLGETADVAMGLRAAPTVVEKAAEVMLLS